MTARELRTLLTGGDFFEGPRWRDGTWWVSDFYQHHVLRVTPDGVATVLVELDDQPSGLGFLPDGSLVISSMKERKVLRWADGELSLHADLSALCGGHLNDLVTDVHGHVFAGDFGWDAADPDATEQPTSLKRVDLDGSVHVAADGLHFPNGTLITDDGRTLVVGESRGNRYTAFDLAPDGTLSGRRVWAAVGEGDVPGQARIALDGCTLDAEGFIWAADVAGQRFVRLAEGGRIHDEIPAPDGMSAFACMLGGDDGRTLLLCCGPGWSHETPAGGAVLLTARVDVPHAGRP